MLPWTCSTRNSLLELICNWLFAVYSIRRKRLMVYFPDFESFAKLAEGHTMVPVYRQLTSDTLTPVSAFCKVQEGEWAFLFESVVGGEKIGRYSFLGSGPFLKFQAWDHKV